ncbi:MAG TPA: L,D-transpeptidase, partial [Polyangiaceae bacterium]|nr:L,D-transpeptidase [Polyangiaceae bacterium]
ASLPIAWIREKPRQAFVAAGDGFEDAHASFDTRTWVALTGNERESAGATYLETKRATDAGAPMWIREKDATVVSREAARPFGVKEGQKWVVVRLTQGTLVAYEDMTPVFATLVSPGAGGVPVPGRDPVKDSTTPTGTYLLTFKDRAATMSPDKNVDDRTFWIQDVPYTQYFNPPFALHGAFWHERFGEYVSAGCVNLSPLDAERLFGWTDPPVPAEWQGATGAGAKDNGLATAVVIRR